MAATYAWLCLSYSDNSPSTAATHKSDLANLAQSDPEFYQFLLSEDRELLEFNEDDVSDDLNQSDEAEDLNQSDDEATTLVTLIKICHLLTAAGVV